MDYELKCKLIQILHNWGRRPYKENKGFGKNPYFLYTAKQIIQVSIFTQERNFLLEEKLEQILETNKIIFKKAQNYYLNSEKNYISIYEIYLINTRN